jgi:hypothetical protein
MCVEAVAVYEFEGQHWCEPCGNAMAGQRRGAAMAGMEVFEQAVRTLMRAGFTNKEIVEATRIAIRRFEPPCREWLLVADWQYGWTAADNADFKPIAGTVS